jgi:hypothetical protein
MTFRLCARATLWTARARVCGAYASPRRRGRAWRTTPCAPAPRALGVPPRDVPIPRGTPGRDKLGEVDGIMEEEAWWLGAADME